MVMDTTSNFGFAAPAAGTPAADYDSEFAAAQDAADQAVFDAFRPGERSVAGSTRCNTPTIRTWSG